MENKAATVPYEVNEVVSEASEAAESVCEPNNIDGGKETDNEKCDERKGSFYEGADSALTESKDS